MLTIREAQMQSFRAGLRRGFENAAVARWIELKPGTGENEARDAVRSCIEKATGYGIRSEPQMLRFIAIAMALGVDFDRQTQHARTKEILADADLSDALRMTLVEQTVSGAGVARA